MERCVRCIETERNDNVYRAYVTDALKLIAENTTRHLVYKRNGAEFVESGGRPVGRWADTLRTPTAAPEPESKPEDNRTTAEIIDQIWAGIEG